MRHLVQALVAFLLAPLAFAGPPQREGHSVTQLIEQLGSKSFEEREAAGKKLEAIGAPALDAVRQTAATAPDAEVKQRAARVGQRIADALAREELKALQGNWKLSRAEYRGAPRAIPGNLFELSFKDDTAQIKTEDIRGGMWLRVRLGRERVRKTVDLFVSRADAEFSFMSGIYELKDGTITLAWSWSPTEGRPQQLATSKETATFLVALKRGK
jgi:uncharacterized protein (TIGR03067 family)